MTRTRHRSALIWLAITAVAFASLARVQAGVHSATAYTHPVLEFLAGHQNAGVQAATDNTRLLHRRSARQTRSVSLSGTDPGVWSAILPVLFVGLVAPLNLISPKCVNCLGRTPSAPSLPSRFQRPPPALLV